MHILNTLPQRLDSGATPTFTGLLAPSLTAPTNLTLAGGSSGASLVLGQGASGNVSLRPTNGIVKVTEGAGATSILQIPVAFGNAYLIGGNLNGGADAKYSYAAFQAQTMQIGRVNDAFSSFTETARFSNTGNLLIGTTTDISGTGGLKVAGTSTASSTTSGALRVGSNVGLSGNAGGASYFGGNVLISNPSSSAFPTFQSQNDNGGNAIISVGTSGSARGGAYFGLSEANLSLIFANGTSSAGLGIGTFNAKPLVLGTNNTAALTFNATTQAATFAGAVTVSSSTASTNTTSGALVVTGGVGVGGAINAGGNLTSPDLILGTSGPSAKSSIAARAARQGLVFDGTSVATASMTTAKSLAFTFTANANSDVLGLGWASGSIRTSISGGNLRVETNNPYTLYTTPITLGKTYQVVYVGVSGSPLLVYLNGVLVITGSNNLAADITANTSALRLGANHTDAASFVGSISSPLLYNRALSAAEVVSLYEAGVPAGADYAKQIAGTALITGNSSTFASGVGSWVVQGAASIANTTNKMSVTGVASATDGTKISVFATSSPYKYRLSVTISNLVGGTTIGVLDQGANQVGSLVSGANILEFTNSNGGGTNLFLVRGSSGAVTSFDVSAVTLVPLGLLLAPDAAQSGGGLTWYDTSGNAANITLPATGVTWNVPTSGKAFSLSLASSTASTNTTSGALVVTGGVGVGGNVVAGGFTFGTAPNASYPFYAVGSTAGTPVSMRISHTDGTNATSNARIILDTASGGGDPFINFISGAVEWSLGVDNSASDVFKLSRSGAIGTTDALTIDGSNAATFAGAVAIGNTVNTVSPTSPNRTVTMVVGGVTYYLAAKTTND